MREQTYHIYLDSRQKTTLLHSLVELKNQLIQQGRYADCVDELIFKVANAPVKKLRIEYVCTFSNYGAVLYFVRIRGNNLWQYSI